MRKLVGVTALIGLMALTSCSGLTGPSEEQLRINKIEKEATIKRWFDCMYDQSTMININTEVRTVAEIVLHRCEDIRQQVLHYQSEFMSDRARYYFYQESKDPNQHLPMAMDIVIKAREAF